MKRDTFDGNFFPRFCFIVPREWLVIGRVEVARPFAMSPFVREQLPSNTNERDGCDATRKAHRVGPLCRWKKMQLKIFQVIWVTDGQFVCFCALRSIDRVAKGRPSVALEGVYAHRSQFMLYAWNLGCANDGIEFHNFILF